MRKFTGVFLAAAFAVTGFAQSATNDVKVTEPLGGTTGMNTTFGPTGLINVPTAFGARHREVRVGGSWGKELDGPSLNYGLIPWLEIGMAYLDRENARDKAIGSAKLTLLPSNFNWLTVGVGTIDPFDSINRTFFVVGSADLTPPNMRSATGASAFAFRVHAGTGSGIYRERLIAGAELIFADRFSIIGEYDAVNVNTAIRYKATNDVQLQAGIRDKGGFFAITSSLRF